VLCSDATDPASYLLLLGDEKAQMSFTDPPYNVNYANSAKDKLRGKDRAIINDNLGDGFYDFLLAALTPLLTHCQGGIYVAMSSSELDTLQAAFRAAGGHPSRRRAFLDLRDLGQEYFYAGACRLPASIRTATLRLARGCQASLVRRS